jgi:hypothetical protein
MLFEPLYTLVLAFLTSALPEYYRVVFLNLEAIA